MGIRDALVQSIQEGDNPSPPDSPAASSGIRDKILQSLAPTGKEYTAPDAPKNFNAVSDAISQRDASMPAQEDLRNEHYSGIVKDQNLGGNFNPDPVPSDSGLAFNMARSRSTGDVITKFKAKYPEGDMVQTRDPSGEPSLLYRTGPEKDWQEYTGTGKAALLAKVATPQAAASIGAAIATGGASIPVQAVTQAAYVAAGSLADYGIERWQGSDQSPIDAGKQALGEGTLAAGAQLLPGVPAAVRSIASNAKDITLNGVAANVFRKSIAYGQPYQQASDELGGIMAPMIGQTAESKAVRSKFKQTAGTTDIGTQAVERQKGEGLGYLQAQADANRPLTGDQLDKLQQLQKDEITDRLGEVGTVPRGSTSSDAGVATQEGIQKYADTSKAAIDQKIAQTEDMAQRENLHFDATPLKQIGDNMRTGVFARGYDGTTVPLSQPSPRVQNLIDRIDQLHGDMQTATSGGKSVSSLQQVTDLRDQAQKLMTSGNTQDAQYGQAIYDQTVKMLDNPSVLRSGQLFHPTDELKGAIGDISGLQSEREGNLAMFKGQLNSPNAESLGLRIAQPGNGKQLAFLRDNSPENFATVQDAFRGSLFKDPEGIATTLQKYKNNPETLNMLMSPEEQTAWQSFGASSRRLNSSVASKALTDGYNELQGPIDMIFGGQHATASVVGNNELFNIIRTSARDAGTTTVESPAAASFRYGLYKKILTESRVESSITPGGQSLNVAKAMSMVKDVLDQAEGRLEPVLRPQDIKGLQNFQTLLSMVKNSSGEATLGSQGIISSLFSTLKLARSPEHYALSAATLWNNERLAQILSSPSANTLFMKAIDAGPTAHGLRIMAGAAALGAKNAIESPTGSEVQQ